MKFYIPDIGDTIQLTEPWAFQLHPERRNVGLGKYYGYTPARNRVWVKGAEGIAAANAVKFTYTNSNDFYGKKEDGTRDHTSFDRKGYNEARMLDEALYNYQMSQVGETRLNIQLPVGTILSIDRIYIKKTCRDFNSVTFYVRNLEGSGKGKKYKMLRFWTKLEDCNSIEFEKIEKAK